MKNKETIIYDSANEDFNIEWNDFENCFSELLEKDSYIITGYFGSWQGKLAGGKFIHTIEDFASVVRHLDYLQIKNINGHLVVNGSHHDGTDRYEIKRLTNKGYELASKYRFAKNK